MNKRFQEAVWLSVRCVPLLTLLGAVPWMLMKWYGQMPDLLMQTMQGAGTVLPWPAMVIDAQQLVAVILQDSGYVAMLALCWIARKAFPALLPRAFVTLMLLLLTLPWMHTGLPLLFPSALITVELFTLYLSRWPARRSDAGAMARA
jgi:hypothetical protein